MDMRRMGNMIYQSLILQEKLNKQMHQGVNVLPLETEPLSVCLKMIEKQESLSWSDVESKRPRIKDSINPVKLRALLERKIKDMSLNPLHRAALLRILLRRMLRKMQKI